MAEFSSTQFNLEGPAKDLVLSLASGVPNEHLGEDGRENTPHVTVRWGIHTENADEVRGVVSGFGPVPVELTGISVFEQEEYDVVKVGVRSMKLRMLNRLLGDLLDCTETHPEYKPHCTLAYVKTGLGVMYKGNSWANGIRLVFDKLIFSDHNKNKTVIDLCDGGKGKLTLNKHPGHIGLLIPR